MTQQRRDSFSTEFGIWLRQQDAIDSKLGFVASNVDYVWRNYKSGEWMLIEEKRFKRWPEFPQTALFELLHKAIKDEKYRGFHYLVFEQTSPDDGKIFLKSNFGNSREISKQQLLAFLSFHQATTEVMKAARRLEKA